MAEESMEIRFPSAPTAPKSARTFMRSALEQWELEGCSAVAELLAVELVTNVVKHVDAPVTLRAIRRSDAIRVEVEDPSPLPPELQHPEPTDDHGRGLLLVDTLANGWGTELREDGKTVWFEVGVTGTADDLHDRHAE